MPDTTILDVLTQEPPKIGLSLQNEGGNTENIGWVTIAPSDISTWKDFTYNNLAAAYGDLLGRQAPDDERRRPRAVDFTESQCLMVNESAVDYLCQTWCEGVIKKSMKECAAVLRERLDLHPAEPSFKSHARTLSSLPNEDNSKKMFLPDWFIHVHPYGEIFVVGDSKMSSKWKSEWLKTKRNREAKKQAMWPLRQIATYCKAANTRYGFLFTPTELVVVRVHSTSQSQNSAGVEYQSIPFGNYGPKKLSVLLSLWALTMMGVNDNTRAYGPKSLYKLLDAWHRKQEGCTRVLNSLSGRPISENRLRQHSLGQPIILPPAGTNHTPLTNPNSSQRNSPVPIPPPEGYSRNLRKQPTDLPPPLITTNLEPDPVPFARLSPSRRTARARSPLSNVRNADETDAQFKDTDVFSRTMGRLATPGATSPRRAEQESTTPGAKKWVVRGLLSPTPSPRPSISPRASPGPEVRNESTWMTPSTTSSRPSDSVLGKRKSAALPTPSIERDNPFTIPRPRNPSPYSIRGDGYGVDERGRNADGSPSVRERTKRRQMEGGR